MGQPLQRGGFSSPKTTIRHVVLGTNSGTGVSSLAVTAGHLAANETLIVLIGAVAPNGAASTTGNVTYEGSNIGTLGVNGTDAADFGEYYVIGPASFGADVLIDFGGVVQSAIVMVVIKVQNLTNGIMDSVANASGSGTSPDSGALALNFTREIAIGAMGMAASSVGGTWNGSFVDGASVGSSGGANGDCSISEGYQIYDPVSLPANTDAGKTGCTNASWVASVTTYQ